MSILQLIPGVGSVEDAARGEIGNLSDDRQNFQGKYNLGDKIRGALGGYTQKEVQEEAAKLLRKDINTSLSKERGDLQTAVTGTPLDIGVYGGIKKGQTIEDYKQQLIRKTAEGNLAHGYLAMPNASIADLGNATSGAQIISLASRLRDTNQEKADDKVETARLRTEARYDAEKATQHAENVRQYNAELGLQSRRLEADIAARQGNLDMNLLKLQMDQGRYMYDAQTRRQERTANLFAALTALGGAFAV